MDNSQNSTEGKTEEVVSAIPTSRPSKLSEAKDLLAENTKLLAQIREERIKIETAAADLMIGGRGFAGQTQKVETQDEKWAREAKVRYEGTGLDPT